ncbi:MAG TPA: hypothetical protein VM451_08685 [Candidatus Limnocylindria bacterium]|nr:hypothetical protein [Candidatus Limnocylindria bacterium]
MTETARRHFPIRLDPRFRWYLAIFGANPKTAWVEVDGETLRARFGWSQLSTPILNIARWSIEGPWSSLTALGIRRGNSSGGDITFGGSAHGGVRIDLKQPVKFFFFRPPAYYLTVDDLDGLAALLAARGIPGEDRRKTT